MRGFSFSIVSCWASLVSGSCVVGGREVCITSFWLLGVRSFYVFRGFWCFLIK